MTNVSVVDELATGSVHFSFDFYLT